jgi:hypothetical protein
MSRSRVLAAAIVSAFAIIWPDFAGADSLESAKEDCDAEFDGDLRDTDPTSCDDYVDAAKQAGNNAALFNAYSIRSLLWQARGDLEPAMRDADLAIAADPGEDYGHAWRAVLIGIGGDYQTALAQLAELERKAPQKDFYGDMALFEYVAGDSTKSVALFRAAAAHASAVDESDERAVEYGFQAALIEYEMKGGDLAPLKAFDVPTEGNGMVQFLHDFYVENKPDSNALVFLRMAEKKKKDAACGVYFAIGHRNAVAGNAAAAKPALETATERCFIGSFEHHAAKKWLKTLGG